MENKKEGITLVEIIIALGLITMLLLVVGGFIKNSSWFFNEAYNEFFRQTEMRKTLQFVSHKINNSSGIVVLKDFGEANVKSDWNYLGLIYEEKDGKKYSQIVRYDKGKKTILMTSDDETTYDIEFRKSDKVGEDRNVEVIISAYRVKGYDAGKAIKGDKKEEIKMSYEATNSIQVVDKGDIYYDGVAIAFKDDSRELGESGAVNIIMTFDNSGSMQYKMGPNDSKPRVEALRSAANVLVKTLSKYQTVLININLFAGISFTDNTKNQYVSGVNPYRDDILFFTNPYTDKDKIDNFIENIYPFGGTNTGDGIRIAYYNFRNQDQIDKSNGREAKKHYILMVDGDSNYITAVKENGDGIPVRKNGYKYNVSYYDGDSVALGKGGNNGYENRTTEPSIWQNSDYYKAHMIYYADFVTDMSGKSEKEIIEDRANISREYTELMARQMMTLDDVKPYVIKCGVQDADDEDRLNIGMEYILRGFGIDSVKDKDKKYFEAEDTSAIVKSFENIAEAALKDLWFVDGPDGAPK